MNVVQLDGYTDGYNCHILHEFLHMTLMVCCALNLARIS